MELQVGVKVFLQNSEGKYLILERNLDKYTDIQKRAVWDIPGGRIEAGAPLLDNLRREVLEETGLEISEPIRLITAQDILRTDKHVVRLTYTAQIVEGQLRLSDEHVAYKWLSLDELKTLENFDSFAKEALKLI
jgi:ADP-ribose pyrophosphatase YjhB (NUDIX family)